MHYVPILKSFKCSENYASKTELVAWVASITLSKSLTNKSKAQDQNSDVLCDLGQAILTTS